MTAKELIMKIELSDELKNRIEEVEQEHIKEVQKLRQENSRMRTALEAIRYQSQFWDLSTPKTRLHLQLELCTCEANKALTPIPEADRQKKTPRDSNVDEIIFGIFKRYHSSPDFKGDLLDRCIKEAFEEAIQAERNNCSHPGCCCVCGHQGLCPECGPSLTGYSK